MAGLAHGVGSLLAGAALLLGSPWPGPAQQDEARSELSRLTQRLAAMTVYSVRVSIRVWSAAGEGGAGAVGVEAWRDGDRFAYRSGPVEIMWAPTGVVVVNHVSRTILLREPVRGGETPAELTALAQGRMGSDGGSGEVTLQRENGGKRIVIHYAEGPLLSTEIETDPGTLLPSRALLFYRPGARQPERADLAYEWNVAQAPSPSVFDEARFVTRQGASVGPAAAFRSYRVVRLDAAR